MPIEPVQIAGQSPVKDISIENNGFFPALSVNDFKARFRIRNDVDAEPVVQALTTAKIHINADCSDWVCEQVQCGYLHFEEIPRYDGDLLHVYQSAVYTLAKAIFIERYANYDTTASGHDRADDMNNNAKSLHRESREHVNHIIGRSNVRMRLI